ncbi:MAG: YecR family lipoprotein, partial [Gluconobacter japonicus]|uniref:YecR family lipoprotein n=1 Tax=Gluconobacter japonicus TaxID=376620 RepID=UPI0039ED70DF
LTLSSCAANINPELNNNSKQSTDVSTKYGYVWFVDPQVDKITSQRNADHECKLRGFTGASFSEEEVKCRSKDIFGLCLEHTGTLRYKCNK